MIDLYKETWKGKTKPLKIVNQSLVTKYSLSEKNGEMEGNPLTTSQPTHFVDINGRMQFNKRKLNELPKFLTQLSVNLAVPIIAEEVVFNYPFMCKDCDIPSIFS